MYILVGMVIVGTLLGVGIWGYAYRLGLKQGRATSVPFRLIDELLDHKIHCCGEDPAVARVELETSLGIEEWESQSLLQRVRQAHRRRDTGMAQIPTETQETGQRTEKISD